VVWMTPKTVNGCVHSFGDGTAKASSCACDTPPPECEAAETAP